MGLSKLTVGDVFTRLCSIDYVPDDGASRYHDEFGHIISPILLTGWPADPRFSHPVVWSTDVLGTEQCAELCQRMLMRSSRRCVADGMMKNRIHVRGTLERDMITRIESRVLSSRTEPVMNWPDPNGQKYSKVEALAWTYLFSVEDVHILAERLFRKRGRPLAPDRLNRYRERAAEVMYEYALDPSVSLSQQARDERRNLMHHWQKWLGGTLDAETDRTFGEHLSDDQLDLWYETFIPYCDALDEQGNSIFGRSFSQLSLTELRQVSVTAFLPEMDPSPHFQWVFEGHERSRSDVWTGVLTFDDRRNLWLIADILPPRKRMSSRDREQLRIGVSMCS